MIVTDRKGRHVAGLSAGDFRLYEDNTPQTIATFVQPVRADHPQAASGRATAPTMPGQAEQRRAPQLITLVMDLGDLHYENLKQACAAASKFVESTIAAGNSIAIYWVDASLHLGVPFTQDKRKALDVLARLSVHVPFGRSTARER